MSVYRASFRQTWPYGGFQDYEYIIVANTESEALGLAIEGVCEGTKDDWEITLIDTSNPQIIQTYERSC